MPISFNEYNDWKAQKCLENFEETSKQVCTDQQGRKYTHYQYTKQHTIDVWRISRLFLAVVLTLSTLFTAPLFSTAVQQWFLGREITEIEVTEPAPQQPIQNQAEKASSLRTKIPTPSRPTESPKAPEREERVLEKKDECHPVKKEKSPEPVKPPPPPHLPEDILLDLSSFMESKETNEALPLQEIREAISHARFDVLEKVALGQRSYLFSDGIVLAAKAGQASVIRWILSLRFAKFTTEKGEEILQEYNACEQQKGSPKLSDLGDFFLYSFLTQSEKESLLINSSKSISETCRSVVIGRNKKICEISKTLDVLNKRVKEIELEIEGLKQGKIATNKEQEEETPSKLLFSIEGLKLEDLRAQKRKLNQESYQKRKLLAETKALNAPLLEILEGPLSDWIVEWFGILFRKIDLTLEGGSFLKAALEGGHTRIVNELKKLGVKESND